MDHSFCPIPWTHLSTHPNGDLRVCCQCIHPPYGKAVKEDGNFYNGARDKEDLVRNSKIFKEIRQDLISGKRSEHCKLCWSEEDLGKKSRRLEELSMRSTELEAKARSLTSKDGSIPLEEFPLTYIDLRLGNLCNFKCRTCGPEDSSAWIEEAETPGEVFNWHEDSTLLKGIESLDSLERIYFTGGEPTLIKGHWELLEKLVHTGKAKNIQLEYNTNVSGVTKNWIDIWSQFKSVFLRCSIDGIHEKAVYLRPPVDWKIIEKNLELISKSGSRIFGAFAVTVNAYNVLHYLEILEYLWEKRLENFLVLPTGQVLENPTWQSIQILPLESKKIVRHRYEEFLLKYSAKLHPSKSNELKQKLNYTLDYMDAKDRSSELKEFWRNTERIDRLRNQSFKETLPEMYSLLQK